MPYVLSFEILETFQKPFDTVGDALFNYEQVQKKFGWELNMFNAKLIDYEKKTYVDLYPGITEREVDEELESVWEWDPADYLRIRPVLKKRYQTTP